jgi:uncharacterized membrane protein (UPF0127 family)
MRLENESVRAAYFRHVDVADTFWKRLVGWMGKRSLDEGEGLLIVPCRSVHTCFMRFPIDVVFINESGKVVHIVHRLKPWRITRITRDSYAVLELSGGAAELSDIRIGDQLLKI